MLALMLAGVLYAGDWADQAAEPKVLTDVTAYTAGKKTWSVGLFNQEYGLLHNVSVGTRAPLFALGVANAHAKVTAVQTPKFDAAITGEVLVARLGTAEVAGAVAGRRTCASSATNRGIGPGWSAGVMHARP